METGTWLIPVLIVVSGVIAFVGNMVGRAVGRRRLTLLGLRPRYTAEVVTVLSGMLITIVTLGVVLLTIQDARNALLRSRELQEEQRLLESQVATLRQQADLLRTQRIAFLKDQEISRGLVDPRAPKEVVQARLDVLVEAAEDEALRRGARPDQQDNVLVFSLPGLSWGDVVRLLIDRGRPTIVRLVADENTIQGTPVKVVVILVDNVLVHRAGTVLVSGTVDGRQERSVIAADLGRLAREAQARASREMLSAPDAPVDSPPLLVLPIENQREAINTLQRLKKPATVRVLAAADTYTAGPLEIRFVVVTPP